MLTSYGITNFVFDSSSIEVNRRKCRVKTDKVDTIALVNLLRRFLNGERKAVSVVRIPSYLPRRIAHPRAVREGRWGVSLLRLARPHAWQGSRDECAAFRPSEKYSIQPEVRLGWAPHANPSLRADYASFGGCTNRE
uniref:Transposase n=1 Tax=Candidatus Kentrum sp. FW TaxID=2126338 RepID=A0A450S8L2_9GAMM|nr:MAG: hypothetical protein BECKFW1821A_GA0114235_101918 [Candidatus Kentron sp. FW]VFJ53582.1 MAG: hypothetical protein BECKFW1821B_GA0114236_101535 [Candidatus Kentron sp. FW]